LAEIDTQCAGSLAFVPPQPNLIDENLRGFVLLLSAHFQGYCRDLHSETAQIIATRVRPTLQVLVQTQFIPRCKLDRGNPNMENLRTDFERFGFTLDPAAADPANPARVTHLGQMNRWRSIAAHQGTLPQVVP